MPLPCIGRITSAPNGNFLGRSGQVAVGDYSPTAPTDPYVRTLAHTVPQIMALLRIEAENASREPEQAGNGEAKNRISSSASSDGRCGD